jgi:prepilin-type processing-associated H-X9-DG protein
LAFTYRATSVIYSYSYTMNELVTLVNTPFPTGNSDTPSNWQSRKITQVKRNAEKVFLVEEKDPKDGRWIVGGIGNVQSDGSADGDDALTNRHSKLANIAFFDSHVERIGNADFKSLINGTTKAYPFQE